MEEQNATLTTLKQYFKEYYFKFGGRVKAPKYIDQREFGYFPFGGQMIRHLSFEDIGAFRAMLVKEAPAGVYCSNSLYKDPSLEMYKKEWTAAELIFDIDADALRLPCKKIHDVWLCRQCGRREFGLRPEVCPSCGGNRIHERTWACRICLDGTKTETFKLLDFLELDLGISGKEVGVFFSGNAGYHVTVDSDTFDTLDQQGRSEISDYLTGQGLDPEIFASSKLLPNDPGWRGRVARYIRDIRYGTQPFREDAFEKRIRQLGKMRTVEAHDFISKVVSELAVRIDPMVTTDIHRIFRMPETLNNKTGLVKKECKNLSDFDPLSEAVAIPGDPEKLRVLTEMSPRFEFSGVSYGPFRSETRELPRPVAVCLMSKGAARLDLPKATSISEVPTTKEASLG